MRSRFCARAPPNISREPTSWRNGPQPQTPRRRIAGKVEFEEVCACTRGGNAPMTALHGVNSRPVSRRRSLWPAATGAPQRAALPVAAVASALGRRRRSGRRAAADGGNLGRAEAAPGNAERLTFLWIASPQCIQLCFIAVEPDEALPLYVSAALWRSRRKTAKTGCPDSPAKRHRRSWQSQG
jgi:hypothetical protein